MGLLKVQKIALYKQFKRVILSSDDFTTKFLELAQQHIQANPNLDVQVVYNSTEHIMPLLASSNQDGYIVTDSAHYEDKAGWKAFDANQVHGWYSTTNNESIYLEFPTKAQILDFKVKDDNRNIKITIIGIDEEGVESTIHTTGLIPKSEEYTLITLPSYLSSYKKYAFKAFTDGDYNDPSIDSIIELKWTS